MVLYIITQKSTEKAGNKINIYQKKSKIPNHGNRRPSNWITEKYLQNDEHIEKRKIVPANRNYAEINAFGEKVLIIEDSHLNKIKKDKLNNSFSKAKCIIKPFSGAKLQDLKHSLTPHSENYKPDTFLPLVTPALNGVIYRDIALNGLALYVCL